MRQTFERRCAAFKLRVTVLEDAVVRVHYFHRATEQPERDWFLDLDAFRAPTELVVDETPERLRLATAALSIEVSGPACAVVIRDAGQTRVLWNDGGSFAASAQGGVQLSRPLADGEHIFGLGEKTGAADRRGRRLEMWNSDPVWTDPQQRFRPETDPLYQSHPFFLSLSDGVATGSLFANTFRSFFDLRNDLTFGAAGGDLDHFFFYGPAPKDVLERYSRLVGRAPLPPRWALGYHQSRWSYTPQSMLEQIAAGFRQRNLPCDGLWLDIDYMRGFRSFTWDPVAFPEPSALASLLSAQGFKLTTILDPGIKKDASGYSVYDDGVAGHHFVDYIGTVWPGEAMFPDFSRAATRAWWAGLVAAHLDTGVRGLWIDMNEPTSWVAGGIPLDLAFDGDGTPTTLAEVNNVYALLMARATYEGSLARFPDRRPFVLTRAGFAGIQRWSAVWAGDAESTWEHLAMLPAMLQGLAVSGVPMIGTDVGGFSGNPGAELYGRWFELAAFSPFFRTHSQTGSPPQEPWAFDAEVESLARRFLNLRYALLPYWYSLFDEHVRMGAPPLRPLWFEFPADAESAAHEDEFLVGAKLLVAPVVAPQVTSRPVYLPPGVWYDFWGGAAFTGAQTLLRPAPLGQIPIFIRAGAIVPMTDAQQYVGQQPNAALYVDVFPGPPGTHGAGAVYDDDGESLAYTRGTFSRMTIALTTDASGATLDLGSSRAFTLRLHGVASAPSGATIDGQPASPTWDAGTRTVTLAVPAGAQHVVVAFDAAHLPAERMVAIDFAATVPAGSGSVYLASSALGWTPNGLAIPGRVTVPEGTLVLYKYTRGDWSQVEVGPGGSEIPNRELWADWGASPVADAVVAWRDRCP